MEATGRENRFASNNRSIDSRLVRDERMEKSLGRDVRERRMIFGITLGDVRAATSPGAILPSKILFFKRGFDSPKRISERGRPKHLSTQRSFVRKMEMW
jgi:hypothetical protein